MYRFVNVVSPRPTSEFRKQYKSVLCQLVKSNLLPSRCTAPSTCKRFEG